jgi:hypothetical protein
MARVFVFLILLSSLSVIAQEAKPNPDDYKVNVHVKSSRLGESCSSVSNGGSVCVWVHELKVEIDGKTYDLGSETLKWYAGVLRTGSYKARMLKQDAKRSYEYNRTYELLFPDGRTRKYQVTAEYE